MASSWGEVKENKGAVMLPEGTRMYTITSCRPELNPRTTKREAHIAVTSSAGSGKFDIPLEPWDENARDTWEKVFKGQAVGLGFVPTGGENVPLPTAVAEFTTRYLPSLLNAQVELSVYHVASTTSFKDDGTAFINQKVYCNSLIGKSAAEQSADGQSGFYVPTAAGGGDDEIVF